MLPADAPPEHSPSELALRKSYLYAILLPVGIALPAAVALFFPMSDLASSLLWLSIDFALALAIFGVITRRRIQSLGHEALQSREALLGCFAKAESLLRRDALILGGLLVLEFGSLVLGFAQMTSGRNATSFYVLASVIVPYCLFYMLRYMLPALRPPEDTQLHRHSAARALTVEQAPQLWALVDAACQAAPLRPPDQVIIGLDEGFYATEEPLYLSQAEMPVEGRSLYLSVPYLAYLSREELAAVITQELGYISGTEAKYTHKLAELHRHRSYYQNQLAGAHSTLERQGDIDSLAARPLLRVLLNSFELALDHWSSDRAKAADALAATAIGPQATARAILRLSTLAPVIEMALRDFVKKGGRSEPLGGLLAGVFETVAQAEELDPLKHLEDSLPHPREIHPSNQQRITALGVALDADLVLAASSREPSGLLEELGLR